MPVPNMSDLHAEWSDLYRPQIYEDVLGQKTPCAFLGGLTANGQKHKRNILLFGDVGSGKTSLARIFAAALNCASPDPETGSPCLKCKHCDGEPDNLFEYDVPGSGGSVSEIGRFVEQNARNGRPDRPTVLFFDEAQSLELKACLYLLKRLEAAQIDAKAPVFVFATTAPEKLAPALRSRLERLHVAALDRDDCHNLLRWITDSEGLTVEDGVFDLVIRYAGRQPRNLIAALELVADRRLKVVQIAEAKEAFGYDQVNDLEEYFIALGKGDIDAVLRIFYRWRLPIAQRIQWVESYLASFYLRTINGYDAPGDAVVDSLNRSRQRVADAFLQRLNLTSIAELAPTWRAMMEFWADFPTRPSEAKCELKMGLFHGRTIDANWAVSVRTVLPKANVGSGIAERITDDADLDEGYLTSAEARDIINASSFFTQRSGRLFNFLIKVLPKSGAHTSDDAAVGHIDDKVVEIENLLALVDPAVPMAAIRVAENTPLGPIGFVAVSLPRQEHPDDPKLSPLLRIEDWVKSVPDLTILFGATTRSRAINLHWSIVRTLLAGHVSTEIGMVEKMQNSGLASNSGRYTTRLLVERVRYWGQACPALSQGELSGPAQLSSKFAAGLFDKVTTGWEVEAFARQTLRSKGPLR
ncbi:DNA polymerase III, delta subunit [Devosia sp. YR412]|nr:DNA polymerase III, delta subunit [Devosia sp. YR412]